MAIVVILVALFGCTGSPGLPAGDPARPDVILVSIDSLRPDHLGAYGNERKPSPFLDSLAERGLRFTEARASSPWTLPSHVTMLSGRGPLEHEVIEDTLRIPPTLPLVQEAFSAAGFSTAGFVSTTYVSRTFGFDRGFSHFEDYAITKKSNLEHPARAERLVADALAWAAEAPEGKPIFLFVHLYDVHYPYRPPDPYDGQYDKPSSKKSTAYRNYQWYREHPIGEERWKHLRAQYDESLAYTDAMLGRLGAAWEASGRKVSWVVTADHGEELGEHGSWGHAHTLHPEVMRVPLVVSGAGVPSAAVRDDRVGVLDVAATVAALGGVPFPSSGVDVRGAVPPKRDHVMETSRFDSARLGLLTGDTRLELDFVAGSSVVYGASDPAELLPAPNGDAALEARAWAAVGERWSATGPVVTPGWIRAGGEDRQHAFAGPGPFALYPPDARVDGPAARVDGLPPAAELSDQTREQLQALGYEQ